MSYPERWLEPKAPLRFASSVRLCANYHDYYDYYGSQLDNVWKETLAYGSYDRRRETN